MIPHHLVPLWLVVEIAKPLASGILNTYYKGSSSSYASLRQNCLQADVWDTTTTYPHVSWKGMKEIVASRDFEV